MQYTEQCWSILLYKKYLPLHLHHSQAGSARFIHVQCIIYLVYNIHLILPDPGVPGVRSMGPSTRRLWYFADVTLADDDTNSIITDDANRANCSWRSSLRRWWSGRLVCPMDIVQCELWGHQGGRQELQGILELWSCWRQCMLLVHWVGDDFIEMVVDE